RLYLRHIPTKRGRGFFERALRRGLARGWQPPVVRTRYGFAMEFEPSLVGRCLLVNGSWEQEQTEVLLGWMHPGDVVLNVGANSGYYALLAAKQVGPPGRVYAFDIQREMCTLVQRNARLNGFHNLTTVNKGCWSGQGKAGIANAELLNLDAGEIFVTTDATS